MENLGNPLELGENLRGEQFLVEGQSLGKINIVTSVKGSGKSHLSKVIKQYIYLPRREITCDGTVLQRGIVHLKAGDNLKIGL